MSRKRKEERIFGCIGCGIPFKAYPPDDRHNIATRNEGDYEEHIEMKYNCTECGEINTIYWSAPGVGIVSGRSRRRRY